MTARQYILRMDLAVQMLKSRGREESLSFSCGSFVCGQIYEFQAPALGAGKSGYAQQPEPNALCGPMTCLVHLVCLFWPVWKANLSES